MKIFISLLLNLILILNISACNLQSSINPNNLYLHFIDVGQGDATLLQIDNKNILIDSGPKDSEDNILNFLHSRHIKKLDLVIATHPHEDHIGNMDKILTSFSIDNFYAPFITSNTKAFETMILELKNKKLKINVLNENTPKIKINDFTFFEVFSPLENLIDENLNNYSPIMKLTFKNNTFLFTGDAEVEANNSVLVKNIQSNLLKLGHHGSETSSNMNFLRKVNPSIGVISCGKNNSYSHPHKKTLDNLSVLGTKIFRTDMEGHITFISDGTNIYKEKKDANSLSTSIFFIPLLHTFLCLHICPNSYR